MRPLQIAIWIIVFAIMTAVLYGIGLSKSMHRERDLMSVLIGRGERKILSALKKRGELSQEDIETLLCGTKSSLFYSRQRLTVQDPKPFANTLISAMLDKHIIQQIPLQSQKIYKLYNK